MFFGQTVNVWEQLLKGKLTQLPSYFHSNQVEYLYSPTKAKLSVYFSSFEDFQQNANFVNLHHFFKVLQECKTELEAMEQIEVEFLLKSDCFNSSPSHYLSTEDEGFLKFYASVQKRLRKFKRLRSSSANTHQPEAEIDLKSMVEVRDTSIQSDSSQHKLNPIPAIVPEPNSHNANHYWDDLGDEWQKLDFSPKQRITNPILNHGLLESAQASELGLELAEPGFVEALYSSDLTGVEVLASDSEIKHQYPNVLSSHFNVARSLSMLSNKDSFNAFQQVKVLSALEVQIVPSTKRNFNLLHEIIADPAIADNQSNTINLDYLNPEVQKQINLAKAPALVKERQVQASASSSIEDVETDYASIALFLNSSIGSNASSDKFSGFAPPRINTTGISTLELAPTTAENSETEELTRLAALKQSVATSRENFAVAQATPVTAKLQATPVAPQLTNKQENFLAEIAEAALAQAKQAALTAAPALVKEASLDSQTLVAELQAIVPVSQPAKVKKATKARKKVALLTADQVKEFESSLDLLFAKVKTASVEKLEKAHLELTPVAKLTHQDSPTLDLTELSSLALSETDNSSQFVESSVQLNKLRNYKVGTANYFVHDLLVEKLKNSFVAAKTESTDFNFKSYFLSGAKGVGKTALVQELIAKLTHASKLSKLGLESKYIADFNSEYFNAVQRKEVAALNKSLLATDLLVIDDCQLLRESSLKYLALLQKSLARYKNKALILLSSESLANLVAKTEQKEVFESLHHCMGLELKLPDLLLRSQIIEHSLKVKFGMTNLKEARLQEIVNFTKSLDLGLTLKLVEDFVYSKLSFMEFVKHYAPLGLESQPYSREQLEQAVFQAFGIDEQELKTKSRRKLLVSVREAFVYLWIVNQQPKYTEIADYLMMSTSNVKRILTKTRKYVAQHEEDFMNKISAIKQQII